MADKLDSAARFGIWSAHKGQCFCCKEIVLFPDAQIDHVVPKSQILSTDELDKLKIEYQLDQNFEIECFENWVCSCATCNRDKSSHLYDASPRMVHAFNIAQMLGEISRKNTIKIRNDSKKANVLVKVQTAVENGYLTLSDVKVLIEDLSAMGHKSYAGDINWIHITKDIKFHTDGLMGQISSADEKIIIPFWSHRPSNVEQLESEKLLIEMMDKRHPNWRSK